MHKFNQTIAFFIKLLSKKFYYIVSAIIKIFIGEPPCKEYCIHRVTMFHKPLLEVFVVLVETQVRIFLSARSLCMWINTVEPMRSKSFVERPQ